MQKNEILEVEIVGFSNLGYGIAKIDGFVIFVEGACPEDVVKIKLTKVTKNYAYAQTINIIKPSPNRVKPFCPMHNICGACQMQFIDYNYQLKLKKQIVSDAIKNIGKININVEDVVPSPNIEAYRHKIQYPVSSKSVSKRLSIGYFKPSSHEIVNIKCCPIQPRICDDIIEYIRENAYRYNISGYSENNHSGILRHVVIRSSNYTGENLVVLVVNCDDVSSELKLFCESIYNEFDSVSGVCINFNSKKTNVILSDKTFSVIGKDYIEEKIIDKIFKIGPNTFFQVNPKSAENIFKYVKQYIKDNFTNPVVLDAYAGISAFGICVSDVCKDVICVEENEQSCNFAKGVLKLNNVSNVEINNMDASKFLKNEKRKYDVIILDPPRKGCTQTSLDETYRLCKGKIIYVSCNPATLARDLKYLTEKGAIVESIKPFDMFCHTYHVESVAILNV